MVLVEADEGATVASVSDNISIDQQEHREHETEGEVAAKVSVGVDEDVKALINDFSPDSLEADNAAAAPASASANAAATITLPKKRKDGINIMSS